jgi:hypothetical protein
LTNPWDWTEDDLLALIRDEREESLTLDYKGSASLDKSEPKRAEISKDISAFANSAGGTIVYGIFEDPLNRRLPGGIDDGLDPKVITREWLEQVINSRIQTRIDGVRINAVSLANSSPGNVAYVVMVPRSLRAPHQAWDKRYYKRLNFESVPMEDYEIRDVLNRRAGTAYELTLRVDRYEEPPSDFPTAATTMALEAFNTSATTGTFLTASLLLLQPIAMGDFGKGRWQLEVHKVWSIARCIVASGTSPDWSPIPPLSTRSMVPLEVTLRISENRFDSRPVGALRFDHDGGSDLYTIRLNRILRDEGRFVLDHGVEEFWAHFRDALGLPRDFDPERFPK